MIRITDNISIGEGEIKESFSRSGGPGGQHVNKVSTAVKLRFDIQASSLPESVKKKLIALGGTRVTNDGVLIISSREARKRELNRTDAFSKLIALIKKASERPKRRIKTRPSKSKIEKRIGEKKARAGTKKMRGRPTEED